MNESFAQFVEATAPALRRFFRKRVGDDGEADDLAQTAYEVLLRHPLFNPSHPGAVGFLRRKARWLVLDHWRRAARAPQQLPTDLPHRDTAETGLELETGDLRARVQRAVAALPGPQREIVLRHLQGRSHSEIAADLALPIHTVYGRFHQAKMTLRRALCSAARSSTSACGAAKRRV